MLDVSLFVDVRIYVSKVGWAERRNQAINMRNGNREQVNGNRNRSNVREYLNNQTIQRNKQALSDIAGFNQKLEKVIEQCQNRATGE